MSKLPSVSTFRLLGGQPQIDAQVNPTQAATIWLRRDIIRGVFAPGARLKVAHLCDFYHIGASPIREAILLVSTSGLIVHEHQRGYRAAPVSHADYKDVATIYRKLYRLALDMAVENGGDQWEERVVLALHRTAKVRKVLPSGDPEAREAWQWAYWSFHHELLSGCNSPTLMRVFRDVGDRLERYVNIYADLTEDVNRNHHAEHRAIVDALIARDAETLFRLVDTYHGGAAEVLRSIAEALKKLEATKGTGRAQSVAAE
ncbi:MAG: FCD domain-containing protein [Alphaproteobacteria bacterium]|nr:FCD domain-containing protein [Alphaproteobacteria bacterium]